MLAIWIGLACTLRTAGAANPPPDQLLPPEKITLKTNDNATLVATYFPSKLAKNAVPVVLVHAFRGSRGDLEQLALTLQRAGHAVIVPDLRGHGDSTPAAVIERNGELRPADYAAMASQDLEAVKTFLIAKNNDGELNVDKLCMVGLEMGAVVALNWAAIDCNWPVLATGKQGQDIKALVLVSPEWSFKGLRINDAVAQPLVRSDLAVLVIAGRGHGKSLQEAKRLHSALEKHRPQLPADTPSDKQTLWLRTPKTSLQATRLLNEKSLRLDRLIEQFIDSQVVKQQIPWSERRNPLQGAR